MHFKRCCWGANMSEKHMKPAIRFAGFTEEWERRKLGDVVDVRSGKDYKHLQEGSIPVYGTGGYMLSVNEALSYAEDAIGIGRKGTIDKPYILEAPFWTVDTLFYAVPRDNDDLNFIFGIFQNTDWKKKDESTGVPSLSKTAIKEIDVLITRTYEQTKIGAYFAQIDTLITLHQRKYDKLVCIKKAMLEKMFPKNGSCCPEIRFAGFTDAWERRKLGELADFGKGQGYTKSDLRETGNPIIMYGRLYTKYQTIISEVDTFVDVIIADAVFSKGGEVILPSSGETAEDIAIASSVEKAGLLLGGGLNVVFPNQDIESRFLAIEISFGTPHDDLAKRAQGKSIVHLYNEDLKEVLVSYPSIEEQKSIASLFSNLDHLITLQQQSLEKLKTLKKAFLEKMFV